MNSHEPNNDIEARLQAMQPADPSPALRQRISASLDEAVAEPRGPWPIHRRVLVGLAAAAVVALAGLVVMVLISPAEPQIVNDTPPMPDERQAPAPTQATPIEPTVFALQTAWRESPEALDDALARQPTRNQNHDTISTVPVLTAADARRWEELEF